MGGLFDTFTIGKRGLSVAQSEINTTSHNIANANTTGYTRQRAVSTTTTPYGGNSKFDSLSVGQVGTGAQISSIERIRDSFIDYQVRSQIAVNSANDIQNTYLTQVEDVLNETDDTGVESALSDFYDAFQTLSTSSESSSNKTVAISAASTLASNLNDRYNQLETKQSDLEDLQGTNVQEINSILDQINDLNKDITRVTSLGLTPNDLMDTRDNLLDELSTKFEISVESEDDNAITVTTGSYTLVDGTDSTASCTRFSSIADLEDSGTTVTDSQKACGIFIVDSSGGITNFEPTSGEIAGVQTVYEEIQNCEDQLDMFAAGLAYTVNAIQAGDDGATLSSNELLFVNADDTTTDSGITAKNITINSDLEDDPGLLNCGSTSTSGEKDGTRALAIADLADLEIDFSAVTTDVSSLDRSTFLSEASLGFSSGSLDLTSSSSSGSTLNDYYTSMISNLATKTSEASNDLETSETQLTSLKNQRTSVSGVSLDEEMTSLIEYQHAYQANAKIISTIDELLDVVINGLMA